MIARSSGEIRSSFVRAARRAIRGGILAAVAVGSRRKNLGAVVNGLVALAVASLPRAVERRYGVEFRPWQRAYTEIGMLAHAVGMLGPYDDTWWWDNVTHTLSATLLGGLVHVVARRRGRDPWSRVVAAVVVGGVLWEILEYAIHGLADRLGIEPVLIPYSARDTAGDLVFDLLGALLVVVAGDRLLGNLVDGDGAD